jgi:SAM-dependent methyltransferase
MNGTQEIERADFDRYFPYTPAALCVKECARLSALRRHKCNTPILDVGCGDGLFASIAFKDAEVWGIDIDAKEGRWAAASQAYSQVVLADVTNARLPDAFFATCVANCSLEHVPRVDMALKNIHRSLRPGGRAYLFVPTKDWARHLLTYRALRRLVSEDVAELFRSTLDAFFYHHHLHDRDHWYGMVEASGLRPISIEPTLSSATTVTFEALMLPSLAGFINKHLTTRWTNFPRLRLAASGAVYALIQQMMKVNSQAPTAEYLIIAERTDDDRNN